MKPASDQESSPLTFGRYEALLRIGRGGMAEVYAGRVRGEAGFQKLVAIKRMLPHLAEDERFSQMFLDEARLAAHISSPYVVTTQDLGRAADGSLYLVMELVVGSTLSSFLRNAARHGACIPLPVAVEVLAQAAQGLHDAHEARTPLGDRLEIVHRDVSPQNILVGVDGRTRITDFGVARAMMRRSDTSTGELKGKLSYFSPEQVQDGVLDRRSDVFALGIVAWETLTSRRLFKADNPLALLDRILNMPIPSVRRFNPDVPEALDEAVQRALSRDLDERFADGLEFAMALRAAYPEYGSRKEISAYVRAESNERIERLEESLRTALARGDQSSVPAPQDARSGITRRNQLAQLKRAGVDQPAKAAIDQTTAASDEPATRPLAALDLLDRDELDDGDFDTISSAAVSTDDESGEVTAELDDDEFGLDAYDDGPTFAMEQPPTFDEPIREDDVPATALEEFDEDAIALAAEQTVAADPYAAPVASQGEVAGAPPFAQPQHASGSRAPEIPWKVIGLIAGVALAIAFALMWFSDGEPEAVPSSAPPPSPFEISTGTEAVEPPDNEPLDEENGQLENPDEQAAQKLEPELQPPVAQPMNPQQLLEELREKQAAEQAAEKTSEDETRGADETNKEQVRRTPSRQSSSSKPQPSRTSRSNRTSSSGSNKSEAERAAEEERKHGRGGIRLDF